MSDKESVKSGKTASAVSFRDIFCSKCIIIAWAAAALALPAVVSGHENMSALIETAASAAILTAASAAGAIMTHRYKGDRKTLINTKKAIDPRLNGSLDDISGIGSTLSVLAAITAAFSEIFIINGGLFAAENFLPMIISSTAKAVSKGSALAYITSQTVSLDTLYLVSAHTFEDKSAARSVCRLTHYPAVMQKLGEIFSVRLTASISLSAAIIICSCSGIGSPFTCIGTVLLCMTALAASGFNFKFDKGSCSEDKAPLWSKSLRSFCTLNVITFVLITFAFMFTFPIRSVYTDYTVRHDFDYYTEVSAEIDILSVPERNDYNSALFLGFFAVSAMLAPITAVMLNSEKSTAPITVGKIRNPAAVILCAAVIILYPTALGIIYSSAALDSIMWLVAISFGCLIITVNLIRKLILMKKHS